MSKLKLMSNVLALAVLGVVSYPGDAMAFDAIASLRCIQPGIFTVATSEVDIFDEGGNFQDDTDLDCDAEAPFLALRLTDLDADTDTIEGDVRVINFATGQETHCKLDHVDFDEAGGPGGVISQFYMGCYASSSFVRLAKLVVKRV